MFQTTNQFMFVTHDSFVFHAFVFVSTLSCMSLGPQLAAWPSPMDQDKQSAQHHRSDWVDTCWIILDHHEAAKGQNS